MPRRPGAFTRYAMWLALVLCVALAITWVVSTVRPLVPTWIRSEHRLLVGVGHGWVEAYYPTGRLASFSGIAFGRAAGLRGGWWPEMRYCQPQCVWYAAMPLRLPALAFAATTLLLWRMSRPQPPGFCVQCRYDLRGNVSGRCPECGRATEQADLTGEPYPPYGRDPLA
jgi:hypothetical protein